MTKSHTYESVYNRFLQKFVKNNLHLVSKSQSHIRVTFQCLSASKLYAHVYPFTQRKIAGKNADKAITVRFSPHLQTIFKK